ncbi:MAG: nitrous oxide reductase accessory protein NosL [Vicinamibacterales bacterium]|nr:nitrous oxide reductase accessory protein NosL [Vicinamibacterales bacterium]
MRFIIALVLAAIAAGCAPPKPVDVMIGEACWRCRRPIQKPVLAAEFVQTKTGFPSKFRTVHCMSTWIAQQTDLPKGRFYVTDYSTGEWVRAEGAVFVNVVISKQTMERDFFAFADPAAAAAMAVEAGETVVDWDAILALGRDHPIGGN